MRHLDPPLLVLALALAVPASSAVRQAARAQPQPALTADVLIARNLAAKGGRERLAAVASARATGRLGLPNGVHAPFVWEWQRPNLVRMEFTTPAGLSIQAFDGAVAWRQSPLQGSGPERLPKEMSDLFALEADFVGPLLDYAAKGHQVTLVAAARGPAVGAAHHLRVTLRTGHVLDILLDAATSLEQSQTMTVTSGTEPLRVEVSLGDYRTVDGVVLPFSVRSRVAGSDAIQTMTFETMVLGAAIDPERFRMPAAAARTGGP